MWPYMEYYVGTMSILIMDQRTPQERYIVLERDIQHGRIPVDVAGALSIDQAGPTCTYVNNSDLGHLERGMGYKREKV